MPKEKHSAFSFIIVGGLDKPFYTRFRELRKKYNLTDKELVECMLWFTLQIVSSGPGVVEPDDFGAIVAEYKTTAPVDMPPLPEVV